MCRQQILPQEYMGKIIAVTNRKLCTVPFLEQIEWICTLKPHAILLREKDLQPEEYEALGKKVKEICERHQVKCIYHTFVEEAKREQIESVHLPMWKLRECKTWKEGRISVVGTSVHSVDEAIEAQQRGADYVIAGHIYTTDCKKGLPPRGLGFLREVCEAVEIPVYAIGGIHLDPSQVEEVLSCGAKGVCIMSELMKAPIELCDR
ncbi:MAG: thiamine phosphate synthase [Lachnospiraceae bacterium]|nr:thiamine phosphate synthase [Robinsoniella sp.]MDY3765780.1 thiamine phosphate synthase [Lachnospiraceae bacterium]